MYVSKRVLVLITALLVTAPVVGPVIAHAASVEDELKFRAGDEEGNEQRALKAELLISKSDEKALEQLKKILATKKGTALEPSLYFRMGELYMRRAKTATFFEVNRDNNSIVRFSPMATKNASSRAWVSKAVATYDLIEAKFTHYRDMDLVLFNNAFARQILGQDKQAMDRYRRVIEDFGESPLVPDCHLAIGESYFNNKGFQEAYDEFQKIRLTPEARVFPYGLYKGAWSLYNLHRTPEALHQLEEVVAYSKGIDDTANQLDLSREALDDMVVFFEDVRKPGEAVAYFRGQGGDSRAGDLALKLGRLYEHHGRHANQEIVYNDLIAALPQASERVQMHRELMDNYETTKQRAKVVVQLETLSDICNEQSNWAKTQTADAKDVCWKLLEEGGKLYSTKWHKEFRKYQEAKVSSPQSSELASLTARAYEGLLKNNKITVAEDKVRYNYAELLFQQNNFRAASEQYSKVAHLTREPKIIHDSAYAALVSLEKAVGDKWSDIDEREFARLAGDYVSMNPKGLYVTDVKFKKAFIAYDKGRYDEAAPQLKDLATHYFYTVRGLKAAHLYLDVLNIQKKYEDLRDESLVFIGKFKTGRPGSDAADEAAISQAKAEFTKVHQQASFTVVQNLENGQRYDDAINGYLAFVKEDPKSALADKALYNAVRCAHLAGNIGRAATLSEEIIENYPQSSYKNELAHSLVTLYEAQAQLGLAAKTLLKLAEFEPDKARSYQLSGADYKALDNDWTAAVQIYTQLSQKSPATSEGRTALERLEAYAERQNQFDKAAKILEQIADGHVQPAASIASHKLAQRAFEAKDEDKAFRLAKRTVSMRKDNGVSARAVAQSRLIQAKILEKEFDGASVKARPDRLSIVLAIKTEKLSNAQKAYQEVISYGDRPTAIEALVRMAACYEKFSRALNSIEAPADAPPADQKKFLAEIENMALPIAERNAETLQLALKQAKDLSLHDGTVAVIQGELNRLARKNVNGKPAGDLSAPENVLPVVN